MDQSFVRLVGIQQILGKLGGFTKAQRQHAGGKRIERAGVAGLLRVQQAFCLDQCVIAGKADRFVQQQNAIERDTDSFGCA